MRIAALLLCTASIAARADDSSGWTGVWTGTIGAMPVTACLDSSGGHWQGSYYYLRHLQTIRIEASGDEPDGQLELTEEKPAGSRAASAWSLPAPVGGRLDGTWTGSGKTLPIRLKRVPALAHEQDETPCRGTAFNRAREIRGSISARPGQPGKDGFSIIGVSMGKHMGAELSSVQLNGSSAAILRVNAQLKQSLLAEQDNVFACARSAQPRGWEYKSNTETLLLTARWLALLNRQTSYCGGAHPDFGVSYQTWNLEQGRQVDPWTWFLPEAAIPGQGAQPVLQDMLKEAWDRGRKGECRQAVSAEGTEWMARPGRSGMGFTPRLLHAVVSCSAEVVLSYGDLVPLMNQAGKDAVATLREAP